MNLRKNKSISLNISDENKEKALVSSVKTAKLLQELFKYNFDEVDQEKEMVFVLHLTSMLKIKSLEIVSIGTLNSSLVHPRETFRRAIVNGTHSIIIAHNHPSTNPEPSQDDISITKRLFNAGRLLGINILDHIIFNHLDNKYYSFRDNRIILKD